MGGRGTERGDVNTFIHAKVHLHVATTVREEFLVVLLVAIPHSFSAVQRFSVVMKPWAGSWSDLSPKILKMSRRSYLHYRAPLRDIRFLYENVYQLRSQSKYFQDYFTEFSSESLDEILFGSMRVAQGPLPPLDGLGDQEGGVCSPAVSSGC